MADFYKPKEVRELLKFRKILFIGDTNVRHLYKDLLSALNQKRLTSVKLLKKPDVGSYFGDVAIQQCGKKSSWAFSENRIYEEDDCRVEMFCTGLVIIETIKAFLRKLAAVPSSLPDIVYFSYCQANWKNRRHLLFGLLSLLKVSFPCTTLFFVGSGFPTNMDSFGDPIFDDVPYFIQSSIINDNENNMTIVAETSSLGFIFLNLAFYLRKSVFRGVAGQPGWESVVVRYTTFLLLTNIAQNLLIKIPGRVNQGLLTKAIASAREDLDVYRVLLLKLSNKWIDVKSKVSVDEKDDPAALNAKEILEKLWKLYRHSRNQNRLDKETSRTKSYKAMADFHIVNMINSSLLLSTDVDVSSPESDAEVSKRDQQKNSVASGTEQTVSVHTVNKESPETGIVWKEGECDSGSLEEGELRESPCSSSPKSPLGECLNRQLLSDISNSEGEIGNGDDAETVAPGTTTPEIQTPRSELPSRVEESLPIEIIRQTACPGRAFGLPSTSHTPPEPFTIEVSDEETPAYREETVVTHKSNEDVIINLESDDSDVEAVTLPVTEVMTDNNPSHVSTKNSCPPVSKPPFIRPNQMIFDYANVSANLYLKDKDGGAVSWPTDLGIPPGDPLWKWWRVYIQEKNDCSITICPKDWPEVHARIPASFNDKGNIAVPKVIDDLKLFFQSLEDIQFNDDCLVDCCYTIVDEVVEDQTVKPPPFVEDQTVKPLPLVKDQNVKPPPFVDELLHVTKKSVRFQIPPRKILKSKLPLPRVSVCSFASYHQFLSRLGGVVRSPLEKTATKQHTSSRGGPQPPTSESHFDADGAKSASHQQHWSPLNSWVSMTSKSSRCSPGSDHVRSPCIPHGNSKKSVDDQKRKRDRSRSKSPIRRRLRSPSPYNKRKHTR